MSQAREPINAGRLECALFVVIDGFCLVTGAANSGTAQALSFGVATMVTVGFLYLVLIRHRIYSDWGDLVAGLLIGLMSVGVFSYYITDARYKNFKNLVNDIYQEQLEDAKLDRETNFSTKGILKAYDTTMPELFDWLDVVDADINQCIKDKKLLTFLVIVDASNMPNFYRIVSNKFSNNYIKNYRVVAQNSEKGARILKSGSYADSKCGNFGDSADTNSFVQLHLMLTPRYVKKVTQTLARRPNSTNGPLRPQ